MILGIIPCSKEKIWDIEPHRRAVPAHQAYRSAFHHYARAYAQRYCSTHIIFSAKYGFMEPNFLIEGPYDITFSRPDDAYISTEELIEQAQNYRTVTSIIILCPHAYAQKITLAFEETTIKLIFPLQKKGGFGAMHTFLKNLHSPFDAHTKY
jgi:hypothetical protein